MTLESMIGTPVVDERRHDAVGIELQIVRLEVILAGPQVELDLLERQLLLREAETHLLAAGGVWCVVENQHVVSPA